MREPQPYALADKTIARLNKKALRQNNAQKQRFLLDGFDELNVLKGITALYDSLDKDNRKAYHELFIARYLEINAFMRGKAPKGDTLEEMAEAYLSGLLSEPDPITLYAYDAEVPRKRDRVIESVNATPGKALKQVQMDKGLRFWSQMSGQYADEVSDGANVTALKNNGVQKVRWVTANDDKVCKTCRERNGKVYDLDRVPAKPHWRCRCYLTPVKTDNN